MTELERAHPRFPLLGIPEDPPFKIVRSGWVTQSLHNKELAPEGDYLQVPHYVRAEGAISSEEEIDAPPAKKARSVSPPQGPSSCAWRHGHLMVINPAPPS